MIARFSLLKLKYFDFYQFVKVCGALWFDFEAIYGVATVREGDQATGWRYTSRRLGQHYRLRARGRRVRAQLGRPGARGPLRVPLSAEASESI